MRQGPDSYGEFDRTLELKKHTLATHVAFLEHWRTDLQPIENDIRASDRASVDFAISGLRTVFLLNGGAIVAVPAFAEVLGVQDDQRYWITYAVATYAFGLFLSALSQIAAYLTTESRSREFSERLSWRSITVKLKHNIIQENDPECAAAELFKEKEKRWEGIAKFFNISALALCIISLLMFIVGAYLSMKIFA